MLSKNYIVKIQYSIYKDKQNALNILRKPCRERVSGYVRV